MINALLKTVLDANMCLRLVSRKSAYTLAVLAAMLLFAQCSSNESKSNSTLNTKPSNAKTSNTSKKTPVIYLSQDNLISFVKRCKITKANQRAKRPFNKLDYNKVIAYDYDGIAGESSLRIVESNKLVSKIKQQQQLSQEQVDYLTNWLGAVSTYGGTYAFCFEPHIGIVFYKDDKIVANISISIGCNFLDSSVPIPATKAKSIEISKGHSYPAAGFSKIGSQKIISLAKDLKFIQ